jgi:hypothetical protein
MLRSSRARGVHLQVDLAPGRPGCGVRRNPFARSLDGSGPNRCGGHERAQLGSRAPSPGFPTRPRRQKHLSRESRLRGGRGCPSLRHPLVKRHFPCSPKSVVRSPVQGERETFRPPLHRQACFGRRAPPLSPRGEVAFVLSAYRAGGVPPCERTETGQNPPIPSIDG